MLEIIYASDVSKILKLSIYNCKNIDSYNADIFSCKRIFLLCRLNIYFRIVKLFWEYCVCSTKYKSKFQAWLAGAYLWCMEGIRAGDENADNKRFTSSLRVANGSAVWDYSELFIHTATVKYICITM